MKYIPGHSFTANFAANNNPSIKARSAGKQKKKICKCKRRERY